MFIWRFLGEFLHPFTLPFLMALVMLAVMWRRRRESRARLVALTVPVALLWVICTPATAYLAMGTLEWSHPPGQASMTRAGAIVVLGGGMIPPSDLVPEARLTDNTRERCLEAARAYREAGPLPIIVSGGKKYADTPGPPVAWVMRDFLVAIGIPSADVLMESRSRTTRENAVMAAPLLEERGVGRVVVVTDSLHLKRSVGCFRALGFDVVPRGSSYATTGFPWRVDFFLPRPGAAIAFQRALHEWVGLAWYWLRGWV